MEYAIHVESAPDNDKLQTLSTLASWHTILSAAKSWNHTPNLQQAEFIYDVEFPSLKYHKRHRNLFDADKYKETAGLRSGAKLRP